MTVVVDSRPFGEGSLRKAHHMYDIEGNRWVAKAHRTPVSETMIFTEVAMQGLCQHLAKCYNRQGAPKPVNFLEAFIIRTHSGVYMQCEEWMPSYFNKHNNNAGLCEGDLTRNTPQALSHFTYAFSKGRCMVVDIQGVEDRYTDPQVHSLGRRFGVGDGGTEGMALFFQTHRCSPLCVGLGLSPAPEKLSGTQMSFERGSNPGVPIA